MSEATQHAQQRPLGSRNPFRRPDEPIEHNAQAEGAATDTSQIDLMTSDFASTGISHSPSPQAQSTSDQRTGGTLTAAATSSSQQQTMPVGASRTTDGMSTALDADSASGLSTSAIDVPSNLGSQNVPSATYEGASLPTGHAGSSASNARGPDYPEPTSGSPVPGRPHLRDGKLLVMPPTWEGCSKCHGTGYQHSDPSHPHQSCWRQYGRRYTPALITSSDVVDGACILQRPLPKYARPNGPPPGAGVLTDSSSMASMPGAYRPPPGPPPGQHPQHTGGTSHSFMPPAGPPPPRHPSIRRPSPPRVNRAEAANEASGDADGEAPPSYDDAVRAPHEAALPPQRISSYGVQEANVGNSNGHSQNQAWQGHSSAQHTPPQQHRPPAHPHPPGPFGAHGGWSPHQGYGHQYSPYAQPQHPFPPGGLFGGGGYPGAHHPYPQAQHPHHHPFGPPSGPLVVQPGDPRIGGQLCYKCGGLGRRESAWFGGDEVCQRCDGVGRLL